MISVYKIVRDLRSGKKPVTAEPPNYNIKIFTNGILSEKGTKILTELILEINSENELLLVLVLISRIFQI
jgi:hypothetical protein